MFMTFPEDSFIADFNSTLKSKLDKNMIDIKALLSIKNKTYKNFIKPFEMINERLEQFFTPLSHINAVKNSKISQKVYSQALPMITAYSTQIGQNIDIFNAYEQIKKNEYNLLNDEQKMVLDQSILEFKLSGVNLSCKQKDKLKEINIKESKLENDFSQNILNAINDFEMIITNIKDVKGIPNSDIKAAKKIINGKTIYKFTLQTPSYIAYMTYGPNRYFREKLYKAYVTKAPQNSNIIDKLMQLRQESAKILGFSSYCDLSLATKMASSPKEVISFLTNLQKASKAQAKQELNYLKIFAQQEGLERLESFDIQYYSEKLRLRDFDINEEAYRPYLEQSKVLLGLFDFLNKLFDMKFKEVQIKLWSKKAKAYDLYVHKKLYARIFTDLEARKDKRDGAWMHNWHTHCIDENEEKILATAFIVCNFPPSTNTSFSLLRHNDVVTLFHEMGHAIHHVMSSVSENRVSGVNGTKWDAVEFPSQFLENFAYEPKVLQMFAKHYETSEVLDINMINKLIKAKNFQSAMGMLRQLEFGLFDFKLHNKLYQADQIEDLLNDIRKESDLLVVPKYNKFQNSFSHIFSGGYAAGYYSYKWAEVLSADAYLYLIDNGIFNEKIANDYKNTILAKGATMSMEKLFEKFRGKKAQISSLLRLLDIKF